MSEQDCLQARKTCDDGSELSAEQLLAAEQHFRSCSDCEIWREQWNAVARVASELPLFDVPESLTQRIMSEVQEEQTNKALTARNLILTVVVAVAGLMMFWMDSFDTIYGAFAWAVGFSFLFGLKYMIQVNAKHDAQLQKQM
ncbi:MAG TPA: hypothetical protein V6C76_04275 [Drouetiella sp.]